MSLAFGLHSQKIANAFTNHTESGQDEPAHRKIASNGLLSVIGADRNAGNLLEFWVQTAIVAKKMAV